MNATLRSAAFASRSRFAPRRIAASAPRAPPRRDAAVARRRTPERALVDVDDDVVAERGNIHLGGNWNRRALTGDDRRWRLRACWSETRARSAPGSAARLAPSGRSDWCRRWATPEEVLYAGMQEQQDDHTHDGEVGESAEGRVTLIEAEQMDEERRTVVARRAHIPTVPPRPAIPPLLALPVRGSGCRQEPRPQGRQAPHPAPGSPARSRRCRRSGPWWRRRPLRR